MAESRHPLLRGRASRALGVAAVIGGLALVGSSQLRMQYIVDRIDEEADLRVATQCVASHERIMQIRDADETAYRRNAETLIEISGADPALVEQYRQLVDRDVREIRAKNPDPACDLHAAKELLDGTDAGNG